MGEESRIYKIRISLHSRDRRPSLSIWTPMCISSVLYLDVRGDLTARSGRHSDLQIDHLAIAYETLP